MIQINFQILLGSARPYKSCIKAYINNESTQ